MKVTVPWLSLLVVFSCKSWIFVAGFQNCCGFRRSFNREMTEDRIIMWRYRDEFWLCWRKSQNDPWFREVKILLKLFMFHTFYLPKWCGKNFLMGNQVCHLSCLSGYITHRIQYINCCTSDYSFWHFWQNLDYVDWLLKVTKDFRLN